MKILVLTTSYPAYEGHIQSPFIAKLCETLNKKVEVDVVCPYYKVSKNKEEHINNVKIHRFQYWFPLIKQQLTSGGGIPTRLKESMLAKIQFPFFFLSMLWKAKSYAKHCDVIHAQWTLSGLAGVILKKIYKKPLVLTTRGAGVNLALKGTIMKKVLKYVFDNCDYITPNNDSHLKTIKRLGINRNKIKTINNGVDKDIFKTLDRKQVRKMFKIEDNKIILLFVGWLIQRKGLDYLLNAMPYIMKYYPNVQLLIVGDGVLREQYTNLAEGLKIKDNVIFLGLKEPKDIALYMNAADIFILPSLSEGKPNVVREAMCTGVPIIATNVNGTGELIKNDINGLLVKSKSVVALEESIEELIINVSKAQGLGVTAAITKHNSWEDSANEYIEVYNVIKN